MGDLAQFGISFGCLVTGAGLGWLAARSLGRHRFHQLEKMARTDPLTRVWNRQAVDEQIAIQTSIARRYKSPLSVVAIDIDHFKKINDRMGHAAGDAVLQELAQLVTSCCRDADIVGRMGGDEFVIILPQTDSAGAKLLAERIRIRVTVNAGAAGTQLRVSLGVSSLLADEPALSLIQRADQALYRAKQNGRDQTCIHDGPS